MPQPPLDSFLSSLGANHLSTRLDPTRPKGQAFSIHKEIEQEIDTVNVSDSELLKRSLRSDESLISLLPLQDQTLSLIKDNWDDFEKQLDSGDELLNQLQQEEKESIQLEQELDGPVSD